MIEKWVETLTKHVQAITMGQLQAKQAQVQQVQQAASSKCDLCGEGHANGERVPEGVSKEANYIGNFQKRNPHCNTYNPGWEQHPNLK